VQDGRIHVELINGQFLFKDKGSPAEYGAGMKLALERGFWFSRWRPESSSPGSGFSCFSSCNACAPYRYIARSVLDRELQCPCPPAWQGKAVGSQDRIATETLRD
jgi:hypothetical protein